MTLDQLLTRPHLLLDFDGPVCAVFGGIPAEHIARHYAAILRDHSIAVPVNVVGVDDPLATFQATAAEQPTHAAFAERALRDLELHAVATAPITPGVVEALDALNASGHTVTIVSNNSADAVRAFLGHHRLAGHVRDVVAREEADPALLKPNPYLVTRAITALSTISDECVLLGDSATDITAGHVAGVPVIAYANRRGKAEAFDRYEPEAVITTMHAIAETIFATTAGRVWIQETGDGSAPGDW